MNYLMPHASVLGLVWALLVMAACASAAPQSDAAEYRLLDGGPLYVGDGYQLYVEPSVLELSLGGSILLAGAPTYLWQRDADGRARLVARDSVFGAILAPNGTARTVPAPLNDRMTVPARAVALGADAWGVIFTEVEERSPQPFDWSVVRLWYGVLRDGAWTDTEPLPLPPGDSIGVSPGYASVNSSSSLVTRADTLAWAVLVRSPGHVPVIAFFTRADDHWSYDQLPVMGPTSYLDLVSSGTDRFLLGVVRANLESGASNALYVWSALPDWHLAHRIAEGGNPEVHHLSLDQVGDDVLMSWVVPVADTLGRMRREVRARRLGDAGRPALLVDASTTNHVVLGSTNPLPVAIVQEDGPGAAGLRLLQIGAEGPQARGSFPNPFKGAFGALMLPDQTILLAGPRLDRAEGTLTTWLVRLEAPGTRADPTSRLNHTTAQEEP